MIPPTWRNALNRLERLYAVAEEIRRRAPQTISAAALAERFDVTRRTMERDLAALRDAGVPLYANPGRSGGYRVVEQGGRAVFSPPAKDVTALLIAVAAADQAPYGDAAQAASLRLMDALPDPTRVAVDELVGRIRTAHSDRPRVSARVKRTLEEAVRQGRVVNITYRDGHDQVTERAVEAVVAINIQVVDLGGEGIILTFAKAGIVDTIGISAAERAIQVLRTELDQAGKKRNGR